MTERPGAAFQPLAALVRAHRRGIPSRPGGICPTRSTAEKRRRQKGQAQRAAHRAEVKRSAKGAGPEASAIAPAGARRRAARCAARLSGPKGDALAVDVKSFGFYLPECFPTLHTPQYASHLGSNFHV
ncbi:hypothetical protein SPM24T3_18491 [Serratia sp. M24T3]|nr:hypothetical protein SPM24T3_18491 [Serratia sp. M24T3]